jgi:uncharacterized protein
MREIIVALLAGIVFALGLGISGMTNPEKVLGFLDVAGRWDPSLAFVMIGAIAVHVGAARWAMRAPHPLWSSRFFPGTRRDLDLPLVVGAALFGLGWGTAGYCPGPAIVDLAAPSPSLITFVLAMVAGTLLSQRTRRFVAERSNPPRSSPAGAHPS